jgi:hypothetical protein
VCIQSSRPLTHSHSSVCLCSERRREGGGLADELDMFGAMFRAVVDL